MNSRQELINQIHRIAQHIINTREAQYNWTKNARPEQLPPSGNWKTWMILAGRGFGKTRTGAETIRHLVAEGYRRICLLGKTIHDVRSVMIDGVSGILRCYPPQDAPKYYPSRNLLIWPNGARAEAFGGDNPSSLRGPQFDCAWIDELAKFYDPNETLAQLKMGLRLGEPKLIITTTPTQHPCIKKLATDPNVIMTRGSTLDNMENLSPEFIESITTEYANTKFGRQEIYGEILSSNDEILWVRHNIQYANPPHSFDEIVVALDPAVTYSDTSDETGMIVVGKSNEQFYILEDASLKAPVLDWAQTAVNLYHKYQANCIVVETNQGGNLARELIGQIDPRIHIVEVRAAKSKHIRAQPVAIMYQCNLVYHTKRFLELENQLLNFASLNHSPDRVDALVWGLTHLKKPRPSICIL